MTAESTAAAVAKNISDEQLNDEWLKCLAQHSKDKLNNIDPSTFSLLYSPNKPRRRENWDDILFLAPDADSVPDGRRGPATQNCKAFCVLCNEVFEYSIGTSASLTRHIQQATHQALLPESEREVSKAGTGTKENDKNVKNNNQARKKGKKGTKDDKNVKNKNNNTTATELTNKKTSSKRNSNEDVEQQYKII